MNIFDQLLADNQIPKFVRVRHEMDHSHIDDIEGAVAQAMRREGTLDRIKPGDSVCITAGSRDVANIARIIRAICDQVKSVGAHPFIIPAMGSHAGAKAEGQRGIIEGYGVTEEAMGAPIRASMDTEVIAHSRSGLEIHLDKFANAADFLIPVGRIKAHTDFRGEVESGICKMLVIGMGKQHGAYQCHKLGFKSMAANVKEFAGAIIEKKPNMFAIGLIENAYHQTCRIEAIPAGRILEEEPPLLEYAKSHACNTMDSRPDTSDIPQRASASAGSNAPVPTSTPTKFTASYEVEDSAKGTLTGNGQTGVSSVEIQADSGTSVNVTAVAAEGFVFYKWSDGVTTATRYDNITKDISVKAMFNDARVELTLDKGDSTIKKGESISITATVKLGGKDYSNSNVQWSVNDELEQNGGTFTFTGSNAGEYTIKAGIEINGTFSAAQIKVTVQADPTSVTVSGPDTATVGNKVTFTANVQNANGDVQWSCEETSWKATGNQVEFTANEAGTYHIHAVNNGADAVFTLHVNAAPTPTPTPTPNPDSDSDD